MDLDRIESLVKLFGSSRARELQVATEAWSVSLRREATGLVPTPSEERRAVVAAPEGEALPPLPRLLSITAPLVGIFRQGDVHLVPGDRVRAAAPVGSIESMKILSPVFAAEDGLIEEVLVDDGHPVEYGQTLFLLQPLGPPEAWEEEA